MRGQWLEQIGFSIDEPIAVRAMEGCDAITTMFGRIVRSTIYHQQSLLIEQLRMNKSHPKTDINLGGKVSGG